MIEELIINYFVFFCVHGILVCYVSFFQKTYMHEHLDALQCTLCVPLSTFVH